MQKGEKLKQKKNWIKNLQNTPCPSKKKKLEEHKKTEYKIYFKWDSQFFFIQKNRSQLKLKNEIQLLYVLYCVTFLSILLFLHHCIF